MSIQDRFLRQLDILNLDVCNEKITIIGAGATGSFVALALAKMGCSNITVYDKDSVEEHNFPNQLFPLSCLGQNKAEALAVIVKEFTGVTINAVPRHFEKTDEASGIVISALDTMKGRKMILDTCVRLKDKVKLLIDPRSGAEVLRILTVIPELSASVEKYKESLFKDEDADPVPCTARAIIYSVLLISSLICSQVKRFLMNQPLKKDILMDMSNMISYFE